MVFRLRQLCPRLVLIIPLELNFPKVFRNLELLSPLDNAVRSEKMETMLVLMRYGAEIEPKDINNRSPLGCDLLFRCVFALFCLSVF